MRNSDDTYAALREAVKNLSCAAHELENNNIALRARVKRPEAEKRLTDRQLMSPLDGERPKGKPNDRG